LRKIADGTKELLINCSRCGERMATVECQDCENDMYCTPCFETEHEQLTHVSSKVAREEKMEKSESDSDTTPKL